MKTLKRKISKFISFATISTLLAVTVFAQESATESPYTVDISNANILASIKTEFEEEDEYITSPFQISSFTDSDGLTQGQVYLTSLPYTISIDQLQELFVLTKPDVHAIHFIFKLMRSNLEFVQSIHPGILKLILEEMQYSIHFLTWALRKYPHYQADSSVFINTIISAICKTPETSSNPQILDFIISIKKLANESHSSIFQWVLNSDSNTNTNSGNNTPCNFLPEICISQIYKHFWTDLNSPAIHTSIHEYIKKHLLPTHFFECSSNSTQTIGTYPSLNSSLLQSAISENNLDSFRTIFQQLSQFNSSELNENLGAELAQYAISENNIHLNLYQRSLVFIEIVWLFQADIKLPNDFLSMIAESLTAEQLREIIIALTNLNLIDQDNNDYMLSRCIEKAKSEQNASTYFQLLPFFVRSKANIDLILSDPQFFIKFCLQFDAFYDFLNQIDFPYSLSEDQFQTLSQAAIDYALNNHRHGEHFYLFTSFVTNYKIDFSFYNSPALINFIKQLKHNHFNFFALHVISSVYHRSPSEFIQHKELIHLLLALNKDLTIFLIAQKIGDALTSEVLNQIKHYLDTDNHDELFKLLEGYQIAITDFTSSILNPYNDEQSQNPISEKALDVIFASNLDTTSCLRSDFPQVVIRALEKLQMDGLHKYYLIGIASLDFGFTDGIDSVADHFIQDKQNAYVVHLHPEVLKREDLALYFSVLINPGNMDSFNSHGVDVSNFKLDELNPEKLMRFETTYQNAIEISKNYNIPYLGICAGHQHLALHSGASITTMAEYEKNKLEESTAIFKNPSVPLYFSLESNEQQSYLQGNTTFEIQLPDSIFLHSYAVKKDALGDTILAGISDLGAVSAIQLDTGIHLGFQFHPERQFFEDTSPNRARLLLENFFNLTYTLHQNMRYAFENGFDPANLAFRKHAGAFTHHFNNAVLNPSSTSSSDDSQTTYWNTALKTQTIQADQLLTIHLPFGYSIEDIIVQKNDSGVSLQLNDHLSTLSIAGQTLSTHGITIKSIGFSMKISIDQSGNIISSGINCESIDQYDSPSEVDPLPDFQEPPTSSLNLTYSPDAHLNEAA